MVGVSWGRVCTRESWVLLGTISRDFSGSLVFVLEFLEVYWKIFKKISNIIVFVIDDYSVKI